MSYWCHIGVFSFFCLCGYTGGFLHNVKPKHPPVISSFYSTTPESESDIQYYLQRLFSELVPEVSTLSDTVNSNDATSLEHLFVSGGVSVDGNIIAKTIGTLMGRIHARYFSPLVDFKKVNKDKFVDLFRPTYIVLLLWLLKYREKE